MPGSLELAAVPNVDYEVLIYLGVICYWLFKLVGVTLAFLLGLGLPKYFHLLHILIMGYLFMC